MGSKVFNYDNYNKYRTMRLSQPKPKYMDIHTFQGGAFSIILNSLEGYVRNWNKGWLDQAGYRLERAERMLAQLGDKDAIETYEMIEEIDDNL